MRRSVLLAVVVHCPHFARPVTATRNLATDRLVACSDSGLCCVSTGGLADRQSSEPHDHDRPFPRGCPVFPSLAKQ